MTTMDPRAEFLKRLDNLVEKLLMEAVAGKPAVPPDELRYVVERLRAMADATSTGRLPPREQRHKGLTRIVIDQWPLSHPLGNELVEVEIAYTRL